MAGRKYDEQLIFLMEKNSFTIESFGCPVQVCPIPDSDAAGRLDPRDRAVEVQHWIHAEKNRYSPPDSLDEQQKRELIVAEMRKAMGFPNRNLNKKEIITRFEELVCEGRRVEFWRYSLRRGDTAVKPAFIFFHGGAWIGGSPYAVENQCRYIAELADAVVFNVDYSLAPEHPYPAGLNDCYAVAKHVADHAEFYGIDRDRVTIGGASAGANLAAAVTLRNRNAGAAGFPIARQILLYPVVALGHVSERFFHWRADAYEIDDPDRRFIELRMKLGRPGDPDNEFMRSLYAGDSPSAMEDPYINPILETDFTGFPDTRIIVGEFDGLRQQGEFYGSLLYRAGVDVKVIRYKGCSHAFLNYLGLTPQAEDLCIRIAHAL